MSNLFTTITINGIPFDQLIAQPTQSSPQNFANMVQQNIQCHPDMKQYLPHIASFVWNYIASKATSNQPRATHFNMIASNGNTELFVLTTLIANMMYIKTKRGEFQDLNQALQACGDWAITRRVNFITINVPDLFNRIQSDHGSINQMATEYVTEINNVWNDMQGIYMGGVSSFGNQGRQQQQPNNGFGMGNAPITGFGQGNGGGMGFGGGQPITGFGNSGNNGGRPLQSVIVRSNDNNAPRENRFNDDLSNISFTEEGKAKQTPEVKQTVVAKASVLEQMDKGLQPEIEASKQIIDEKGNLIWSNLTPVKAPWTQTRFQSHPVMFDSNHFELNRRGFTNEGVSYVVDTLKKAPVDRKSLSLPPATSFLENVTVAKETREQFREGSMLKAASAIRLVRDMTAENEYLERYVELRENGHVVIRNGLDCLEEAVTTARQAVSLHSKHEYGAFTAEFFLAKKFVVLKDDVAAIQGLGKCRTIASLIETMEGIIQDPSSSHMLRVAVVQINHYLAQAWMEWLRYYLGMDQFTGSNSFIDDAQLMREDITELAGANFKRMADLNQQRFIQTYLAIGEAYEVAIDTDESLAADKAAETKDRGIMVVPIMTPSMVVCLEFLDCEFGFKSSADIDGRDIAATFSETSTSKGFRTLAQTMVESPRSIGLQAQIRRFYVATLDGVYYEVNLGLDEATPPFLIKKVK